MELTYNIRNIKNKFNKRLDYVKPIFTQEVLKDINYYSPKMTGNLIASSIISSDFKKGKLIWNTKYAKKVYNAKRINKRFNKNASTKWVEVAEKNKKSKWFKMLNRFWST